MQLFQKSFQQLAAYEGLTRAMAAQENPVSLTGVSQIHKANLLAALCSSQNQY